MKKMKTKCPQCKSKIDYDPKSSFRPFCSKRCQLIDLGDWADGKYLISTSPSAEELLEENEDFSIYIH